MSPARMLGAPGHDVPPAPRLRWYARTEWILALALLVRAALIIHMGNHYYFADTLEYEQAARGILAGHGPGPDFPRAPLYPALMALAFLVGGTDNYAAARVLQLAFGIGIVWLMMVLARRIGIARHAWIVGWAAALAPTLVFTTSMLYPTALYTFVLLAVVVAGHRLAERPDIGGGVLLGVLGTLLVMTDQVGLAPLAAVAVWLAAALPRGGMRLAAALGAGALVLGAGLGSYSELERRTNGQPPAFMAKPQYVLFMVRHHSDIAGLREVRDTSTVFQARPISGFLRQEVALARRQPLAYFDDYAQEFVHFFRPMPDRVTTQNVYTRREMKLVAAVYFLPVLVLFLFGVFLGAARWRDRVLLILVPLATDAAYSFFFTQTRYRVPVEPYLLILAVLGLLVLLPRPVTPRGALPAEREPALAVPAE